MVPAATRPLYKLLTLHGLSDLGQVTVTSSAVVYIVPLGLACFTFPLEQSVPFAICICVIV
jgi:hypothetical protein